jgi:hypothetical protein
MAIVLLTAAMQARAHGPGRMGNAIGQEMIVDAPWRVTSNVVPVLVGIHDANAGLHSYLTKVTIWEVGENGGQPVYQNLSPGHESGTNTWFNTDVGDPYLVQSRRLQAPGDTTTLKVEVEWNVFANPGDPFTNTQFLYVRRGALSQDGHTLPSLPGWFPGDVHYHTEFTGVREEELTEEITEFGGAINFLPWAAGSVGLRWMTATDHAFYLDDTRWGALQSALVGAEQRGAPAGAVKLLRGEEASPWDMTLDLDLTLHCLIYGQSRFVDASEKTPATDLADMLAVVRQQPGSFAYGAHPYNALALGGTHLWSTWDVADYAAAFESGPDTAMRGLQIWNARGTMTGVTLPPRNAIQPFPEVIDPASQWTHSTSPSTLHELLQGLVKWDELLMRSLARANAAGEVPRRIFVSGGSDAHGDCNYTISYSGDFHASEGAIGKPRTYVFIPAGDVTEANVLDALGSGRAVMSDGPIVVFGVDLDGNGVVDAGEVGIGGTRSMKPATAQRARLILRWDSTGEFGPVERLRIVRDEEGLARSRPRAVVPPDAGLRPAEDFIAVDPPQFSGTLSVPLGPYLPADAKWYAFRVEAYSHVGDEVDVQPQSVQVTLQDGSPSAPFVMDDWWNNAPDAQGETYRCYTNPVWLKADPAALEVPAAGLGALAALGVAGAFALVLRRSQRCQAGRG